MADSFFPPDVETQILFPPLNHAEFHRELDSTNSRALAYLIEPNSNPSLPALFVAEHQQAGRGRGSNQWWAGSGSLTYSLVVETTQFNLTPKQWPIASLLTGLSICKVIETLLADSRQQVQLKWPNDVYLNGKKVCGILIEAPPEPESVLVIGIGINVNNSFAQAPAEIQATGTSLYDTLERYCDLTAFLKSTVGSLWHCLESLPAYGNQLPHIWNDYCLLTGKQVTIQTGSDQVIGHCQGMNGEGALLLATDSGVNAYYGGTVVHFE